VASPWTVEITRTAAAGLDQLLEEHGEDAYRDALLEIINLEEDPTPEGAVLLRNTKADYRIYLHRALYRAVYRVSPGRRRVIVLRGTLALPTDVGTGRVGGEQAPLSRSWMSSPSASELASPPYGELFWDQVRAVHRATDATVCNAGEANTRDNFAYVFDRKLEELVINQSKARAAAT
jgi:mRNA-degrading endonuclease RelE of RelBE toxin-antitoxin system